MRFLFFNYNIYDPFFQNSYIKFKKLATQFKVQVHILFKLNRIINHTFTCYVVGRVLNRFSKDIGHIDDALPLTLYDFLQVKKTKMENRIELSVKFSKLNKHILEVCV